METSLCCDLDSLCQSGNSVSRLKLSNARFQMRSRLIEASGDPIWREELDEQVAHNTATLQHGQTSWTRVQRIDRCETGSCDVEFCYGKSSVTVTLPTPLR